MSARCQANEETLVLEPKSKKSQPQTTEAFPCACFVQVLSPRRASQGGWLDWKFEVVGKYQGWDKALREAGATRAEAWR